MFFEWTNSVLSLYEQKLESEYWFQKSADAYTGDKKANQDESFSTAACKVSVLESDTYMEHLCE